MLSQHGTCTEPFSQSGLVTMAQTRLTTASKLIISPFCNFSPPKEPTKIVRFGYQNTENDGKIDSRTSTTHPIGVKYLQ